jgi:hypothetical protein
VAAGVAIVLVFVLQAVPASGQIAPAASSVAAAPSPFSSCVPAAPGLYCGGGHSNLTAPYVVPPTPPATGPDGMSIGAVGKVGAQGQIGPGHFSRGPQTIRGVTPATSLNLSTTVGYTVIAAELFTTNLPVDSEGNDWNLLAAWPSNGLSIFNTTAKASGNDTIVNTNSYVGGPSPIWAVEVPNGRTLAAGPVPTGYENPAYPSPLSENAVAIFATEAYQTCGTSGGSSWEFSSDPVPGGWCLDGWSQNVTASTSPEISANQTASTNLVWVEIPVQTSGNLFTASGGSYSGGTPGDTPITENTFWGNETISLLGNVTISGGATLTVDDSTLTFVEPPTSVGWSFGIHVEYSASQTLACNINCLILEDGTVLTQASSAANSFFVTMSLNVGMNYDRISNTTLDAISTHEPATAPECGYDGCWAINEINRSLVEFPRQSSPPPLSFGDLSGSSYMGVPFYANGTLFKNANVTMAMSNDTLINCQSRIIATLMPGNSTGYDTFDWLNSSASGIFLANGVSGMTVTHDLFENLNLTTYGARIGYVLLYVDGVPATANAAFLDIDNNTIANSWMGWPSGTAPGSSIVTPMFQTTDAVMRAVHNTITNFTFYQGALYTPPFSATDYFSALGVPWSNAPALSSAIATENLVDGLRSFHGGDANGMEDGIFWFAARNVTFTWNVEEDWATSPRYAGQGPDTSSDPGTQIYNAVDNYAFSGTSSYYALPVAESNITVSSNWWVNLDGTTFGVQVFGHGAYISDNTVENLSNAGGVGVSGNTGAAFVNVTGNVAYGVYNGSIGLGDIYGGEAYASAYSGNIAYDVDTTSWGLVVFHSGAQVVTTDQAGATATPILLQNVRGRCGSCNPVGTWEEPYTQVKLSASTVVSVDFFTDVAGTANQTTKVAAGDFWVTSYNSYLPASLFSVTRAWTSSNGSALNLTGYLGIYSGHAYDLNSSTVKGESSLPVYFGGGTTDSSQVASIPQNGRNYLYTLNVTSTSRIAIGVNSSAAPAAALRFGGLTPGSDYTVTEYDQGNAIAAVNYYANAQGVVNQTFDPATMPLDPIFAIAPAGSGGPGPCTSNCGGVSPTPGTPGFSLTFNLSIWTIVGAVVAFVGLIVASSGGKRFIPGTGIAVIGILVFVVGTL